MKCERRCLLVAFRLSTDERLQGQRHVGEAPTVHCGSERCTLQWWCDYGTRCLELTHYQHVFRD